MNLNNFLDHFENVKQANKGYNAKCPICNDKKHLHIDFDKQSKTILLYCQKNCSIDEILTAKSLNVSDLYDDDFKNNSNYSENALNKNKNQYSIDYIKNNFKPYEKPKNNGIWHFNRLHTYFDENKTNEFIKVIYKADKEKSVMWFTKEKNGKYSIGQNTTEKPTIYNAEQVLTCNDIIFIVEGEKDAETLQKMNFTATTSPNGAGSRWSKVFNYYFKNKNVVIINDNDNAGIEFAEHIKNELNNIAKKIYMLNPLTIYKDLSEKCDISDIYDIIGADETIKRINNIIKNEFEILPNWIIQKLNQKGEIKGYDIDEPLYTNEFLNQYNYKFVNDNFYNNYGVVSKNKIKNQIQTDIEKYIKTSISVKLKSLFEYITNKCFENPSAPPENKIFLCNGNSLEFDKDGNIAEIQNDNYFTFNRLNVDYLPNCQPPTNWINFLNEIFIDDDILTLQEYLGYCLIPTTKAQKSLFIIGKGREGKSRIGRVLKDILGNSLISDKIQKLEADKFLLAQLDNKLVFYDDDLNTAKLRETGTFKSLVTNEMEIIAENKGKDKFKFKPYARFLSCGNATLTSCFDKTDGFYRRLMIITCKDICRTDENDNRNFYEESLKPEIDLIFNWCLIGLTRLIKNGYNFTISEQAKKTIETLKNDDNNIIEFLNDENYIEFPTVNTVEKDAFAEQVNYLYEAYKIWCDDNNETPQTNNTFNRYLKNNQIKYHIIECKNIRKGNTRARGYKNIKIAENIKTYIAEKKLCIAKPKNFSYKKYTD